MQAVRIKDIYAGKPDAKDEVNTEGYDKFIESFVIPDNFNIDDLLQGNYCFITGYKGTGKTALLYYLDNSLKKIDSSTCSSFIFFKDDYTDMQRKDMDRLSKRLVSSISFGNDVVLDGQDFEYIWRWLFYQRIWEDNSEYGGNLFIQDDNWNKFDRIISRITTKSGKGKLLIPKHMKFSIPFSNTTNGVTVSPELDLSFSSARSFDTKEYRAFTSIIDELDHIFPNLIRSDIPYYIFVDELEAYYGELSVFKRDLKIIRDLIFTVKKLNTFITKYFQTKTKIICSVRLEILNAINRFIISKELNKVTSGFEVPLVWDYANTNSFEHPILKILLKRIDIAEQAFGNKLTYKELIRKWFPESVNHIDPANYILNNSWFKPRDIVRLISSAKSGIHSSDTAFKQATFEVLRKKYSLDSWNEVKEEMRALYTSEEIEDIISCIKGFKSIFSFSEIKYRVERYFSRTILGEKLEVVLRDLYRLGIIGNYMRSPKSYRWQHKGDQDLIISDEWSMMIHMALQNGISTRSYKTIDNRPQIDEIYQVTVIRIVPNYIIVRFQNNGSIFKGVINISNLSKEYVDDIYSFTTVGAKHNAKILYFSEEYQNWNMSLII
ncbi:hypothetical protein E4665_15835 [Sporolactobacillus shoreae]|uniref:S1 motif domain-containing protein n=1 Tax=Sporolactobacillus shoreae TaxID=1465501 RepID=A0A4Z0GHX6_9BACL|nr:hypothetical protein [Sporolactobacillus shoreae]TGA96334.1 hypothetical protein E4665_15835 [Sporolactobacillus shoreae]